MARRPIPPRPSPRLLALMARTQAPLSPRPQPDLFTTPDPLADQPKEDEPK